MFSCVCLLYSAEESGSAPSVSDQPALWAQRTKPGSSETGALNMTKKLGESMRGNLHSTTNNIFHLNAVALIPSRIASRRRFLAVPSPDLFSTPYFTGSHWRIRNE